MELTESPQNGVLTYFDKTFGEINVQGTFYIKQNHVMCLRKRGKNWYSICHVSNIVEFEVK
jgi:hypothetical protein